MSSQETDFKYFLDNREALYEQHPNQYLVIKDKKVIAAYDDQVTAYTETTKTEKPGTFIIQFSSSDSVDTQVFHTRVVRVL